MKHKPFQFSRRSLFFVSLVFYNPFSLLYLLLLSGLLIALLFFLLFSSTVISSFQRIGINPFLAYFLFWLALFGSQINIPLKRVKDYGSFDSLSFFGMHYVFPRLKETVISINLGGALVPLFIDLFLIYKIFVDYSLLVFPLFLAVFFVSVISYYFSRVVEGIGIQVPFFIPPLAAVLVSLPFPHSAILAYVSGTLGTLIGADIMNLPRISKLNSSFVSIGGAGTFDGIFLTGVFAVLLVP